MKFLEIKNITSYHPTDSQTLDLSKKIILIYGLNGSGKSTIANYFNHDNPEIYKGCQSNLDDSYNYIVYNKKFIDDNFYKKDKQPGIFTLSKENKETEIEIKNNELKLEELNKKHKELLDDQKKSTEKLEGNDSDFQNQLWDKFDYVRNSSLGELIRGPNKSKKRFFSEIKNSQLYMDINFNELINEYNELKNGKKNAHSINIINPPKYNEDLEYINILLNDPIIASENSYLSEIIDKLSNSDWVKFGMDNYIRDSICPFCQQNTISDEFKKQLKFVFDNTYYEKINEIEKNKKEYIEKWEVYHSNMITSLEKLKILPNDKKNLPLNEIQNTHQKNIKIFDEKIKSPSSKFKLHSISDKIKIVYEYFTKANNYILEINKKVNEYENSENDIRNKIWYGIKQLSADLLKIYNKNIKELEKSLNKTKLEIRDLETNISILNGKIVELRQHISNIDETIENINNNLKNIGITNIYIKKINESNHYKIYRENEHHEQKIYTSLSEGEKTLITFLYFIEMCKGKTEENRNNNKENLIVIDDPISSLSYNYIYDIASFARYELFKHSYVSKVILLTHNLFFFHELIKLAPSKDEDFKKDYGLYRIYKNQYSKIEKIKRNDIKNEYQTLWQTIKDAKNDKIPVIMIPNIMRNILEYYFAFIHNKDSLGSELNKLSKECNNTSYKAFYRYMSRGSHSDPINIDEFRNIEKEKYFYLFESVFKETKHIEHYNKMME
ncbi:AAA family ATPase [Xenorhabdus bovienii]|uniref:AAA family ATPase n=1 Tax=Xenorhabdus bovienii TaxID=40576 RepID=UPI0023B2B96D|nr:AAA family ATPase [Xenorhabdus bovienii]MDE9436470.1 AAA family ATPase [Xenorhabdus bovienii]